MMKEKIISLLGEAVKQAFPELEEGSVELTWATQEKFGHYQCNSAMKWAKVLKKTPREIADCLVKNLKDSEKIFEKIEVAGPGFINLTLSASYLSSEINRVLRDPRLGIPLPGKRERIIVEFSSPNIAKEMHVGHLRCTIIGDALARLFEFLGHDVIRINHVGDWGTAFGMLITYMQEEVPEVLTETCPTDLSALMGWYRASKKRFDEDEEFKKRARNNVVALQRGDEEVIKAWKLICEISRKAFQEIYDLLDVKIEEMGESFYNPMLAQVVSELEEKRLVVVSEGAKCVFHDGFQIPLMVQKSDGGYNYDTTDIAAMKYRIEVLKADRIIILTDAGQSLHFALVYETVKKAGYLDPERVRFDHVPFGVVLGADGKKFRTRSGETEKLIDLLTRAVDEARVLLEKREEGRSKEQIDELARILGIDAVKYGDLSNNRISDYLFSYEKMLRFEGNTATFILYSYVRVAGIKRKVGGIDIEALLKTENVALQHSSEKDLSLHLLRFGEVLEVISVELFPNYLTEYLYHLAQKFNAFFRDCRVEGSESQASRLLLCEAVARTMKQGLDLLGLKTVERM